MTLFISRSIHMVRICRDPSSLAYLSAGIERGWGTHKTRLLARSRSRLQSENDAFKSVNLYRAAASFILLLYTPAFTRLSASPASGLQSHGCRSRSIFTHAELKKTKNMFFKEAKRADGISHTRAGQTDTHGHILQT